jgi:hypothetical protein
MLISMDTQHELIEMNSRFLTNWYTFEEQVHQKRFTTPYDIELSSPGPPYTYSPCTFWMNGLLSFSLCVLKVRLTDTVLLCHNDVHYRLEEIIKEARSLILSRRLVLLFCVA